MRIANGLPAAAPLLPGMLLLAFCTAFLAAVAAGGLFVERRLLDDTPGGGPSALTMADTFGLGGLPSLTPGRLPEAGARSPVERNRIVAYYGSPRTPSMGILGEHTPEDAADLLAARAERFRVLDPSRPVLPALQLVYAIAQPESPEGGLYLRYVDDRTVRQFIELARRRGFALILDLQIGHSDALSEVQKVAPYLQEPDVFVALDPEFALSGDHKPGEAIGSIHADDINAVQWYLAVFSATHRIPEKLLVVHQFQPEMIAGATGIERMDGVDLAIDMDGYGPSDIKEVKYRRYAGASYAPFGGIKVFLEHDPDPLTEEQLLTLDPPAALVIYQ